MSTRIDILTDRGAIDRIAPDWATLHRAAGGGPFSSAEWISAHDAAYGDCGAAAHIACIWRDGQIVAGLPLGLTTGPVSSRGPKMARLEMLSDERAGFHDILVAPGHEDAIALLLAKLIAARDWSLMDLTPVAVSKGTDALVDAARAQGLSCRNRVEITTAIADLDSGWDDWLARRSRDFRKSLRKAQTRLEEGDHAILTAQPGTPEAEGVLQGVLDLSSRCWKARMGTDIGSDTRIRAFMTALWERLSRRDAMRVHLLVVDGCAAASYIALEERDTAHGMVTDFDETFRDLSPGRVIVAHGLADTAARGLTRTDFLRRTGFTDRLADRLDGYQRLRICRRFSLADTWLGIEDRLRPLGRAARKRRQLATRKRVAFKD